MPSSCLITQSPNHRIMVSALYFMLIALFLLIGCTSAPTAVTLPPNIAASSQSLDTGHGMPVVGEPAPDFSYTRSDGKVVRLSDFHGKVVIVNFWATWCGPCRQEMPDLQHAADASGEQIVVLGVNKLEEAAVIVPFASELAVRFTLVANPAGDIPDRYGVRNLPTSFFIRPDGTVGDWRLGAMDAQMIQVSVAKTK
jgi:cytochrome c biogenesis protein CcmG, thiol:disulfide interchange protein DsbE